jgi:hypothetical protein
MGTCCASRDNASEKEAALKPLGTESIAITLVQGEKKHAMNAKSETKVLQLMKDVEIMFQYKDFELQLNGK